MYTVEKRIKIKFVSQLFRAVFVEVDFFSSTNPEFIIHQLLAFNYTELSLFELRGKRRNEI